MQTILDRIHQSSIELLTSFGVRFHCPETLERLAMMGVCVAGGLVRFTEIQVHRVMELGSILSGDDNVFKAPPQFNFFRGCLHSHPLTRKTMKTRLWKTSVMPRQSWRNSLGVHVCLKKSLNGSMHI